MRITHVTPYMHPDAGGPPVVVDRLSRRLAARGHAVRVVTTDALAPGTGWESVYADGGYELEVHRAQGKGPFAYSPTLPAALAAAAADSDLIQLHGLWTYPTLRAAWACRKWRVPYLVMPHGMLDPNSVRRKRLKKWLYARFVEWPNLRHAAGMLYTHEEEERLAKETLAGLPPGWVVPLAADDPPADPRDKLAAEFFARHGNLAGRKLVIFLGRLHPKKGLDLLVPAFAAVRQRTPDAHLILVGPGEAEYVRTVHADVARHDLQDAVTFTGPLAGREKWAALAAAAVFVLPSYQENFALTVVEALRIGTPVVLSPRVNIWPDVANLRAGLVSTLEATDVAGKVERVLHNTELAANLAQAGRDLAVRKYSWDRTADAAEAAYRSVLNHPRESPTPAAGSTPC